MADATKAFRASVVTHTPAPLVTLPTCVFFGGGRRIQAKQNPVLECPATTSDKGCAVYSALQYNGGTKGARSCWSQGYGLEFRHEESNGCECWLLRMSDACQITSRGRCVKVQGMRSTLLATAHRDFT